MRLDVQKDFITAIIVVFTALLAFGSGYLIAAKPQRTPIIFKEVSEECDKIEESDESAKIYGQFVGSVSSNKYHHPDCPWAQKIASYNQIWFDSEREAEDAGYMKCGNFDKYNNN